MASRLVLRRQLRHVLPDSNKVLGYWVQVGHVKPGAVVYWDGRWYEKMHGPICKMLLDDGKPALDRNGFVCYQDMGGWQVPVFITSLELWNNPNHGPRPQAQDGPAPPEAL